MGLNNTERIALRANNVMNYGIYISGPISADPDHRKKFDAVENYLIAMGYSSVINPDRMGAVYESNATSHNIMHSLSKEALKLFRLKRDADMMKLCKETIFLPGWEKASGCIAEYMTAVALEHRLWFLNNDKLNDILKGEYWDGEKYSRL